MKSCPKCSSTRICRSHVHTFFESIFRYGLGYHYYRCKACGWRGRGTPHKHRIEAKPGIVKQLTIYAVVILLALVVMILFIQKSM